MGCQCILCGADGPYMYMVNVINTGEGTDGFYYFLTVYTCGYAVQRQTKTVMQ